MTYSRASNDLLRWNVHFNQLQSNCLYILRVHSFWAPLYLPSQAKSILLAYRSIFVHNMEFCMIIGENFDGVKME